MIRSTLVIGLTLAVVVLVPQSANLKAIGPQNSDQPGSTEPLVTSAIGGADEVREEFNQIYPLALDGRLVIDNWDLHGTEVDYASLGGGTHELRVQYFQVDGWAELRLDILRGVQRSPGSPGPH